MAYLTFVAHSVIVLRTTSERANDVDKPKKNRIFWFGHLRARETCINTTFLC